MFFTIYIRGKQKAFAEEWSGVMMCSQRLGLKYKKQLPMLRGHGEKFISVNVIPIRDYNVSIEFLFCHSSAISLLSFASFFPKSGSTLMKADTATVTRQRAIVTIKKVL